MTTLQARAEAAADAWEAFCRGREAMNAARPDPMFATPAERALYDERYKVDHAAEREHFRTAIKLAQVSREIVNAFHALQTEGSPDAEDIARAKVVIAFLRGEGPLDGCHFGEKPQGERGNFWWRKHLARIEAVLPAPPEGEG